MNKYLNLNISTHHSKSSHSSLMLILIKIFLFNFLSLYKGKIKQFISKWGMYIFARAVDIDACKNS